MEGKIRNAAKRAFNQDIYGWLVRLLEYLMWHNSNPSGLIHPTHKTPEEKKELKRKRAKRKRHANKNRKH